MRWKPVVNAFCPTGEGGGQDNSCGKEIGYSIKDADGRALGFVRAKNEEEALAKYSIRKPGNTAVTASPKLKYGKSKRGKS